MDLPHVPDMTLSIGSPAFNADIHDDAADAVKLPHHRLIQSPWLDISNCSTGSKRKRGKSDALPRLEVSGLSFQNDLTAEGPNLGLCSTNPSPCSSGFSTGSRTSTGTVFMRGTTEEGAPMNLGLGLAGLGAHSFENSCITSSMSGRTPMLTSVSAGMRHSSNLNLEPVNGANVLLGLGPLHCPPINNKSTSTVRKAFNAINDSHAGCDLGMQLQLSLSNSSTIISNNGRMSHISLGQGNGSAYTDTTNGSECVELNLVADDEGSTSARTIKTGGYIPSLLMGRRPDGVPLVEREEAEQHFGGQRNLVHQDPNGELSLGCDKKSRQFDDFFIGVKTPSGNIASSGPPSMTKTCKFRGCGKGARGASGLCITHGGGRRCQRQGCNKGAEGRTVYCKSHGGGRRCQTLGCTKSAEGKTDYCIAHGGGHRCSQDGCTKAARGRSGLCIRHGGGKRCQKEGCTKSAEGYSGLCISHGGGRRCQVQGCKKGAQGSTMFCKAHGGGKRCMIQGCMKGAEGSTPLCKGHGGGKRCMFDGGGICTKSVHGGTSFCVAHGGGKRCAAEGCTKSARGRTPFCVKHGGGKRCKFENCTKSAQGSTDFCKAHGGGKRCSWGQEGSPYIEFVNDKSDELFKGPCDRFARGKIGLCAAHSALVQDQRVHGAGNIGTALPAGIGPGLFRGLVTGLTAKRDHDVFVSDATRPSTQGTENCDEYDSESGVVNGLDAKRNHGVSVSESSKQSSQGKDNSRDYGSESGGSDAFRRGSLNTRPHSENQGSFVEDNSQHAACSFREALVGFNKKSLRIAGNDLFSQNQSLNKINNVGLILNNGRSTGLWARSSSLSQCKATSQTNGMSTGNFHSPNFLTAMKNVESPALGDGFMAEGTPVRCALLPPQVLVPPSMKQGQFLRSHGGGNNVKASRVCNAVDMGNANASTSLSLYEGRVHGGRKERLHGENAVDSPGLKGSS